MTTPSDQVETKTAESKPEAETVTKPDTETKQDAAPEKDTEPKSENPEDDVEAEVVTGNWNLPKVELKEVDVRTGEEEEEEFWKHRSKLYRWAKETSEWKERGLGDGKLMKDSEGRIRFLLRQEKTGKVVANHYVIPRDGSCTLTANAGSDTTWVWSVLDCSEDPPQVEQFALRFGQAEAAKKFKEMFEEAGEINGKLFAEGKFGNGKASE